MKISNFDRRLTYRLSEYARSLVRFDVAINWTFIIVGYLLTTLSILLFISQEGLWIDWVPLQYWTLAITLEPWVMLIIGLFFFFDALTPKKWLVNEPLEKAK
jgi:hypothetical protein